MTDLAPPAAGTSPAAGGDRRNRAELGVSGVLAGVALFVLIDALRMTGRYAKVDPIGPRAFPYIVAGGLFLTAVLLAVNVLRGGHGVAEGGEDIDLDARSDWRTVGLLLAVFVANIALVDLLGWVISGGLLFFATAVVLGSRHWIRDLVVSAALSLTTFYGFWVGLGIYLPAGILDGIL